MLLPNKHRHRWAPALALAAVLQSGATPPNRIDGHAPDRIEISRAVAIVKSDPNLATEHKVRTLRWIDETHRPANDPGGSLNWVLELIAWVAQSARLLVWVAIAVLIGLLGTYLIRLFRSRNPSLEPVSTTPPTHVQDLDIRPESLPENIGAAARSLWDAGEHRAALSLLYRGLLSRLAHVHSMPVRDSTTEGDCLRLVATRLPDTRRDYAKRLIQTWLQAVYGGRQPESSSLYALCDEFATALDVP